MSAAIREPAICELCHEFVSQHPLDVTTPSGMRVRCDGQTCTREISDESLNQTAAERARFFAFMREAQLDAERYRALRRCVRSNNLQVIDGNLRHNATSLDYMLDKMRRIFRGQVLDPGNPEAAP